MAAFFKSWGSKQASRMAWQTWAHEQVLEWKPTIKPAAQLEIHAWSTTPVISLYVFQPILCDSVIYKSWSITPYVCHTEAKHSPSAKHPVSEGNLGLDSKC